VKPALKKYIPSLPAVTSEAIAVLIGTVVAAYIISQFPKLKRFVVDNSVSLTDGGPFIENQ